MPKVLSDWSAFFRLAADLRAGLANLEAGEIKKKKGDGYNVGEDDWVVKPGECPLSEANVVSSEWVGGGTKPGSIFNTSEHKVVLDLDMDAVLIPSSTPGHHHLIIDTKLPWPKYEKLLKALAEAGVIEQGYYKASKIRGASWIRTPWTSKA